MHILFFSDNFPPETNALASRTYEHAREWVKLGNNVTILTTAPNAPEGKVFDGYRNKLRQIEYVEGIRVVRVISFITSNSGFLRRILDYSSFMLSAIFFGLFERRVDVIVGSSPQFFNAVGAWVLSKLKRKPFIFELRDIWPASINAVDAMKKDSSAIRILERIESKMYQDATRIVAVTNSFKTYLLTKGIDEKKIDIVLNGVDLTHFKPVKNKSPELLATLGLSDKFVVGYIGTLGMAHDLKNVITAASLVKNPSIHFIFVGAGAEKQYLQEYAKKLQLTNVTFVPRKPKSVIPEYWGVCDLALIHLKNVPLFADVIPSKIFEAMGMGKAILHVQPKGEAVDITLSSGNGAWVEPGNPESLSLRCDELSKRTDLVNEMSQKSIAIAPNYSRSAQALRQLTSFKAAI